MPSVARQRGRTKIAANITINAKAPAAQGLNSSKGKSNHNAPKAHRQASAITKPTDKRHNKAPNLQIMHFIIQKTMLKAVSRGFDCVPHFRPRPKRVAQIVNRLALGENFLAREQNLVAAKVFA